MMLRDCGRSGPIPGMFTMGREFVGILEDPPQRLQGMIGGGHLFLGAFRWNEIRLFGTLIIACGEVNYYCCYCPGAEE